VHIIKRASHRMTFGSRVDGDSTWNYTRKVVWRYMWRSAD